MKLKVDDIKGCKGCTIQQELKESIVDYFNNDSPKLEEFVGIAYYSYEDIKPFHIIKVSTYSGDEDIEHDDVILIKNVKVVQSHKNDNIIKPILVVQVEGYNITHLVSKLIVRKVLTHS